MSDVDCTPAPGSSKPCCSCGKWPLLGLLIVLLIAAATRLIGLGHLDVWGDEIYSFDASSELLPKLLKWETPSNDTSPWSFIEIKIARQVFGSDNFLSLRIPSALHGIAAVGLLYLLVGFAVGWRFGFAAALMLAVNPWCLEWAREGRMYQQWLSATVLLMAALYAAVEHARRVDASPLNWRWWLIGVLFMVVHAMHLSGAMTIGGAGLWLGLMAVIELVRRPAVGFKMLLGSALATLVYLGSWGLTGIAKMMMMMSSHAAPAADYVPPKIIDELIKFATFLTGHLPLWAAAIIWAIAAAGFVGLMMTGRWRFALLILMVSLSPWIAFPTIAKRHFFDPRYVFTGLLVLTVGFGAAAAFLWEGRVIAKRSLGAALAIILVLGATAAAAPYLREVFLVPKMAVRSALAPVQQHGKAGEVFMLFPDYYVAFDGYKPYHFGDTVKIIRGPKGTWLDASDTFKDTFDNLYGPVMVDGKTTPRTEIPPAAWLFLLRPDGADAMAAWEQRFKEIEPVLAAYGVTAAEMAKHVEPTTYTLTLRLSKDNDGKGHIDHATRTQGRRFR